MTITVTGGRAPAGTGWQPVEVTIDGDRIVPTTADQPVSHVEDVAGRVVLPGLVDLHTHIFRGQEAGVDPDTIGAATGVTTMLDAGSAGGHLFDAFRTTTIDSAATRVRALVNVATIGITSFVLKGELHEPAYRNLDAAIATIERHRDVVIGVKVRASHNVGGPETTAALAFAREVADATGLPLTVHLGPAPAEVDRILETLQGGDILTHCFTGWAGNTLLDDNTGRPRASAVAARQRGVLFDVGHGASGFDPVVARAMLDAGFPPDAISSDLHSHSVDIVADLPTVINKFLALGMPLADAVPLVTSRPAQIMGLASAGVGALEPGLSPADVAVFDLRDEPFELDVAGETLTSQFTLVPYLTVRAGHVVHRATGRLDPEGPA